ncbi:hypothetical protein AKG11_29930, partial [Shinella sp. SUS2]|uniref:hypothetical protein n=1 Tax=unclassified Shinella TaxID=2643062 RepID=UPI0006A44906
INPQTEPETPLFQSPKSLSSFDDGQSWNSATSAIDGNHFRVLFLVSAVVILFAAAAAFLFGRSRADELRKVAG